MRSPPSAVWPSPRPVPQNLMQPSSTIHLEGICCLPYPLQPCIFSLPLKSTWKPSLSTGTASSSTSGLFTTTYAGQLGVAGSFTSSIDCSPTNTGSPITNCSWLLPHAVIIIIADAKINDFFMLCVLLVTLLAYQEACSRSDMCA